MHISTTCHVIDYFFSAFSRRTHFFSVRRLQSSHWDAAIALEKKEVHVKLGLPQLIDSQYAIMTC